MEPGTGLLALSVLGIAAFTLVFQGRSRYLLTYVPLVVALSVSCRRPRRPARSGGEDDGGPERQVTRASQRGRAG